MDKKEQKKLLDKYIDMLKHFTDDSGDLHDRDFTSLKLVIRNLETKEDVLRVLTEEYLKEYKENESWYVDEVFKTKTEVKKLRVKKRRLDTKTRDYEKQLKKLKRELIKVTKQVEKLDKKVNDRKKLSEELNRDINVKRNDYKGKELELKSDIQGDGTDDEYYLHWFKIFTEIQFLFSGDKISISNLKTYPSYRMRFFGGKGTLKSPRNGFTIHGRYPKKMFDDLKNKLKRTPKKEDLLPFIIPQIQYQLRLRMSDGRFDKYLRRKTQPIGSGYGKYQRKK
jgi:hypothetical protein